MSYTICGTCSICGGQVTVPSVWHGVYPPNPTCRGCGAIARSSGPVIDMEPNITRTYADIFPEIKK